MILGASFAEVLANQWVTVSAMRVSLPRANPLHDHSLPQATATSASLPRPPVGGEACHQFGKNAFSGKTTYLSVTLIRPMLPRRIASECGSPTDSPLCLTTRPSR